MTFPWRMLATEVGLCGLGLFLLLADLVVPEGRKRFVGYLALLGLLLLFLRAAGAEPQIKPVLGGTYLADGFTYFFRLLALGIALLVVLLSLDYLENLRAHRGEFFAIVVFATLALILLAGSNDLLTVYLFVEFVSLTSYILVGYQKFTPRSNEASIKYLLYGAVASAVMLYGMSLLYGATGTTNLQEIAGAFGSASPLVKMLAALFILVGLGFKVAMVPFHQWAPDVYEGAPTPITAFLSVGPKAAGFAVLFRVLMTALVPYREEWALLLALLATATMFLGNWVALVQGNIKRMLAYSSIAHAGYLLIGVVCNGPDGAGAFAVIVYLIAYVLMNLGAFAVVIWVSRHLGTEDIGDYAGLGETAPFYALAMTIFLLSLTGVPPTAGFVGKFWLFKAALQSEYWWLAVVGIVNSVISLGYYFNVVRLMYLRPARRVPAFPRRSLFSTAVIGLTALLIVAFLINQNPLLQLAQTSRCLLPMSVQIVAARPSISR